MSLLYLFLLTKLWKSFSHNIQRINHVYVHNMSFALYTSPPFSFQCFYGCWLLRASKRDDPKSPEKQLILLSPVYWKMAGQNIMMGNLADTLVNRQGNTRHGQLLDTWWQRWCWRTLHTWGWFPWKRTGKWSLCSRDHLPGLAKGAFMQRDIEKVKKIGKEHGRGGKCGVSLQHHSLAFVLVGLIEHLVVYNSFCKPCFSNKRYILLCVAKVFEWHLGNAILNGKGYTKYRLLDSNLMYPYCAKQLLWFFCVTFYSYWSACSSSFCYGCDCNLIQTSSDVFSNENNK